MPEVLPPAKAIVLRALDRHPAVTVAAGFIEERVSARAYVGKETQGRKQVRVTSNLAMTEAALGPIYGTVLCSSRKAVLFDRTRAMSSIRSSVRNRPRPHSQE